MASFPESSLRILDNSWRREVGNRVVDICAFGAVARGTGDRDL